SNSFVEHDLFRKPVSTPVQARGKLFRDHALFPAAAGPVGILWLFIPERKSKFIKSLRNQLSPTVISRVIDRPYDPSFFVSYDPSFFLNYLHFVVSFLQLIIGCGILVALHALTNHRSKS